MGWRFRRSVKVLPGLHLNLSRSGLSLTAGVRGVHVTTGKRGTFIGASLQGTGISYRDRISGAPIQPGPSRVPLSAGIDAPRCLNCSRLPPCPACPGYNAWIWDVNTRRDAKHASLVPPLWLWVVITLALAVMTLICYLAKRYLM